MRKALLAALITVAVIPAAEAQKVKMTPMELQAMQQKEFETSARTLFRSVVSVFQDLGYTISTADFDSGLITASSATTNKTNFWDALGGVRGQGNTRATATVEELPNGRSAVRLNFVSSKVRSGAYGQQAQDDKPILDPQVYQVAFDKIDEALFVRSAIAAPSGPAKRATSDAASAEAVMNEAAPVSAPVGETVPAAAVGEAVSNEVDKAVAPQAQGNGQGG